MEKELFEKQKIQLHKEYASVIFVQNNNSAGINDKGVADTITIRCYDPHIDIFKNVKVFENNNVFTECLEVFEGKHKDVFLVKMKQYANYKQIAYFYYREKNTNKYIKIDLKNNIEQEANIIVNYEQADTVKHILYLILAMTLSNDENLQKICDKGKFSFSLK